MSDVSRLVAVDPGQFESAWMLLDCESRLPLAFATEANAAVLAHLDTFSRLEGAKRGRYEIPLMIEMVSHYGSGMAVGQSVFDTCVVIGRMIQAWRGPYHLLKRREIKLTLCGNARAKDSNIRQALIDRYEPTGGGRVPQIGVKARPGPLFGIHEHQWAALAVGVTWVELYGKASENP